MKSEFLMLAQTYKPGTINLKGWYMSEKLDGTRAFWDGGVTRGIPASAICYANTVKDYRLTREVIATGLWSRTGKVIHAPDYWLDGLPSFILDGELWLGRNEFQNLTSIVSTKNASRDRDWKDIEYKVFDSPCPSVVFCPRDITVRDYKYKITGGYRPGIDPIGRQCFSTVHEWLRRQDLGTAVLHEQELLIGTQEENEKRLQRKLETLLMLNAEGIMLRNGSSYWVTQRSKNLLKFKPWRDAEGTVVGFTSGKETNKGSRLLGKIGALILDFNGKRLELSGLTDAEREFHLINEKVYAEAWPGKDMPVTFTGAYFDVGDIVTFKYRELSDSGIPKEARYWRKSC